MLIPSGDGADKHTAESSQARSHNTPSLASLCVFFSPSERIKRVRNSGFPLLGEGRAAWEMLPHSLLGGNGCTAGHSPALSGPSFAGSPEGRGAHTGSSCWDLRGFCAHLCRPETFPYTALRAGGSQGRVLLSKERCESCSPQPAPNWPWLCRRAQP